MDSFGSGMFEQSTVVQEPPAPVEYAGIFRRFIAMIIDYVIYYIILGVVGFVMEMVTSMTGGPDMSALQSIDPNNPNIPPELLTPYLDYMVIIILIVTIIGWLYYAGLESSSLQGTLGKRLMGIKVTDLDGDPIGFGTATGRFLGKAISSLILGIGYLMAAFTGKKQALHDMIAGTLVMMRD